MSLTASLYLPAASFFTAAPEAVLREIVFPGPTLPERLFGFGFGTGGGGSDAVPTANEPFICPGWASQW